MSSNLDSFDAESVASIRVRIEIIFYLSFILVV